MKLPYVVLLQVIDSATQRGLISAISATGSGGLAERVAEQIAGHIRLGEPVTAVRESAVGVDVVTAAGTTVSAKRCVLAAPLNTLGDIVFTPGLPPVLAKLVDEGHTGRCVKVWAKMAGLHHVFAMGWPGVVECTLKATVSEESGPKGILASFGLEPDITFDRTDLLQHGLDQLAGRAAFQRRADHGGPAAGAQLHGAVLGGQFQRPGGDGHQATEIEKPPQPLAEVQRGMGRLAALPIAMGLAPEGEQHEGDGR
jgi:hypothetical protein